MKIIYKIFYLLLLSSAGTMLTGILMPQTKSTNTRPPYASDKPIHRFKPFAEGIIATPGNEYNSAFTPDGKTIYFTVGNPTNKFGAIVRSNWENGKWSQPEVVPFSGQYTDFDVSLSRDGSKLFFASNRPLAGQIKTNRNIWVSKRNSTGWNEPESVSPLINLESNEQAPFAASDGTLYFTSDRPGGKGSWDIYRSKYVNGVYIEPENLGDAINTNNPEMDPCIASDNSYMLFYGVGRIDDLGHGDLYISYNKNGIWTTPKNLGPEFNTPAVDAGPSISPDGRYLFSSGVRSVFDKPLTKKVTYKEAMLLLHGIYNGLGNMMQIDLNEVLKKQKN